MYLRTTTLGTNNSMLNYISTQTSQYNKLSEEAASGVKVAEPSDDPSAARSILNINTQLSQLQSYLDNMSASAEELKTLDSSLSSLNDLIQDASDLATQAANGTYSDSDLDGIKTQVDSIIEGVISIANTKYNGNYIFSGTNTSTQTYETETDDDGNITAIIYNGTASDGDYERKVTISDGVTATINATGESVFGEYDEDGTSSGLLGTLMSLSTAIGDHDQTAVSSCLTSLDSAMDTVLATQTKFASVANKFDITTSSIESTVINLTEYKSDLQNADLSVVLADLAASEVALQATYSVTSQLLGGLSLLDYM